MLTHQICIVGSPIYMSWPHFLHGSEELIRGVEGLSPDPEKHSFILDVDPVSTLAPHYIYAAKQQNIV